MKRREVLKGLTIATGGALWPKSAWSIFLPQQTAEAAPPLALPIRGLVSKNGTLQQPIWIHLQHSGPSVTVVTKLNGEQVDSRVLSEGKLAFQVYTAPVSAPQDMEVSVTVGEDKRSTVVKMLPVRKLLVYILPHSHHDLGYTGVQSAIEEKQMRNISLAIDLARKTANYPEGARFVWNLEVLWSADLYMRRKSQAEKDEFIDAVKKGWININGMYANELTGLCRPEELLQLFRYSTELSKQCGVSVDSAMISDVPGFTWGTVTAMSQAGLRYLSAGTNNNDRIGRIRITWSDKPFWLSSPSGKEKVLVWLPGHGYSDAPLAIGENSWKAGNSDMVADHQQRLDDVKFPYEISYIRWSGHGDNGAPDPDISEYVKTWNQQYEWPKFSIVSTSTAFSAFEKRHGSEVPQFKGDLTPYWEDGAGSSALETGMNRNSADRLTQAEALAAMLPAGAYKAGDFQDACREAWRNVLLYSEHTWGAAASVRDPDNPICIEQWEGKRAFAVNAENQSKALLSQVLHSYATGKDASTVDVHNSTSWPRSELVVLSREMSAAGDHVKDHRGIAVASQRLSTGELVFLAREVPAFGSARFHLSPEKPHAPAVHVSIKDGLLENGIIRARVNPETGNLVEFAPHGNAANLVDAKNGEAVNEYLFLEGSDTSKIQKSGPVTIAVEESGPLVASLRIESSAPGCNSLVRRVRLTAGADWIELSNVVDKKPAPRNPHPGNDAAAHKFADQEGKESVQFAFPFAVPGGKMHIDIPLAEMQPEIDQLPGSCKNWLVVGRWVDVSNADRGVTWVSLDAPLIEAGGITANMLGGQGNPLLWREHIEPTQKFYSWAMNNHWETNYRAYQEGVVEFRYALRANSGYDPAAASRFAIGLSQPLRASIASSGPQSPPLLQIEPPDVLALTLKPGEDGNAWIVRLFGASGHERKARLRWSTPTPPRLWLSNLSELQVTPVNGEITVAGWDLVTLRAEPAG